MTYSLAAKKAIQAFENARRNQMLGIKKTDEFRTLKTYESTGLNNKVTYVMFGLEYCSPGEDYKELIVRVGEKEIEIEVEQ